MASHSETEYTTADGNDYPAHEGMYDNFLLMVAVGICHVLNVCIALAIGGVKGAWWTCAVIVVVATVIAAHGLMSGARMPGYVMVVISLVILALI